VHRHKGIQVAEHLKVVLSVRLRRSRRECPFVTFLASVAYTPHCSFIISYTGSNLGCRGSLSVSALTVGAPMSGPDLRTRPMRTPSKPKTL
jgi:hypothetical protein